MNHRDNEEFIDLGEILRIILIYKWYIVLGLIISGLASVFIALSNYAIFSDSLLMELTGFCYFYSSEFLTVTCELYACFGSTLLFSLIFVWFYCGIF